MPQLYPYRRVPLGGKTQTIQDLQLQQSASNETVEFCTCSPSPELGVSICAECNLPVSVSATGSKIQKAGLR